MSLKFSELTTWKNVENVKKIFVITNDDKPVQMVTKKCDSFGVKKSEKYETKTISIVLDEDSSNEMKRIISVCEEHLKRPLTKILYERNDDTVTIYPKIRDFEEFRSVFYDEKGEEIDPMNFKKKHCEIKAVLEIEGILVREDSASLQVKIYECMVRKKVYEHTRILNME